jgi:hypothetical protein
VCLDDNLHPVLTQARLATDAIYLDGEIDHVLYFTQAKCFEANAEALTTRAEEPGCCECLASRTNHRKPCLEDTIAGCRERFDPEARLNYNLHDADGFCVSFLCQSSCEQ